MLSEKQIELKQEVQDIFNHNIYNFFTKESDPSIWEGAKNINEQRLFRILNGIIEQKPEGRELLEVLKTYLEETGLKISFYTCEKSGCCFDSEGFLRKVTDKNLGKTSKLDLNGLTIPIQVNKENEEIACRAVFDGEKIFIPESESLLGIINLEAYMISHEVCHAISCLDFLDSIDLKQCEEGALLSAWGERKSDWEIFFSSDSVFWEKINFPIEEKKSLLNLFFINTEEARNLLGFYPKKSPENKIGEYAFARDQMPHCLPVYFGALIPSLKDEDKKFLRTIAENLGISLQNMQKGKNYLSCVFV